MFNVDESIKIVEKLVSVIKDENNVDKLVMSVWGREILVSIFIGGEKTTLLISRYHARVAIGASISSPEHFNYIWNRDKEVVNCSAEKDYCSEVMYVYRNIYSPYIKSKNENEKKNNRDKIKSLFGL